MSSVAVERISYDEIWKNLDLSFTIEHVFHAKAKKEKPGMDSSFEMFYCWFLLAAFLAILAKAALL